MHSVSIPYPVLGFINLETVGVLPDVLAPEPLEREVVQPWTSNGLHGSWVSRWRESLRIHGQLTLADVRDSHWK